MILVISHEADPHAAKVLEHLRAAGQHVLLLDLSDLPARAMLTVEYGANGRPHIWYEQAGRQRHALHDAQAVWWRRPQAPDLSSVTDANVHLFTANEWNEAINGLWQLLRDARWMNDPTCDDAASRKANQLRVAADVGLNVPATLITSDPSRVSAFVERCGAPGAIYKTFSCTHTIWRETRVLRAEDLEHVDAVRLAPVIFQAFVPKDYDLRITAVGGQMFPAAIRSASDVVDFRATVGHADVAPVDLPRPIATRLRKLLTRLGLVYGAIDMRRTPDGDYYFFEVNTAGEFLFVEDRTAQPIARAVAQWLTDGTVLTSPA